jgi:hypothetical protein
MLDVHPSYEDLSSLMPRTDTRYCGSCLFVLPDDAGRCEIKDKISTNLPERDSYFQLGMVKKSAQRGCRICAIIYNRIHKDCSSAEDRNWLHWSRTKRTLILSGFSDRRSQGGGKCDQPQFCFVTHATTEPSYTSSQLALEHPLIMRHPNPRGDIDIDSCIRSLKSWMDICSRSHKECQPRKYTQPPSARIIRIFDNGEGNPVVRLVKSSEGFGEYVCLSHCWGNLRPGCIITRATLEDNEKEILWSSLPKTFRDAILVTMLLGKEHIWIDSICIIQPDNDDYYDDWRIESAKMSEIYQNSFLTIMATMARDRKWWTIYHEAPLRCR